MSALESAGLWPRQRDCWFHNCGVVPFKVVWRWQQQLVCDRIQFPQQPDALILVEHPPVYTLGQGASLDFLRFDPERSPYEIHRVERGGEVTYHCPGQLVGYPILNLRHYQQDLHWYLRQLEAVLIDTLALYEVQGERIAGLTGVWVQGRKLAAIGIKVSRWVTMHGFALNVCPDLAGFERIVPCGICDRSIGSLAEIIPEIDIDLVRQQLAEQFAQRFNVQFLIPPQADGLTYG